MNVVPLATCSRRRWPGPSPLFIGVSSEPREGRGARKKLPVLQFPPVSRGTRSPSSPSCCAQDPNRWSAAVMSTVGIDQAFGSSRELPLLHTHQVWNPPDPWSEVGESDQKSGQSTPVQQGSLVQEHAASRVFGSPKISDLFGFMSHQTAAPLLAQRPPTRGVVGNYPGWLRRGDEEAAQGEGDGVVGRVPAAAALNCEGVLLGPRVRD